MGLVLAGCLVGWVAAEGLGLFASLGEAWLFLLAVGWWPALIGYGFARVFAGSRPFRESTREHGTPR